MTAEGVLPALLVGLGGMLGAVSRHLVGQRLESSRATLVVNVLGSVALGAVVAGQLSGAFSETAGLLFGTGFCGAFTTFSSFAVEVASRSGEGRTVAAGRYAVTNLAGALLGVGVGAGLVSLL
ncbi:CrcB protein [Halogranum gelatinilyticum]|uniref:Fluoride-specific ion channel FluC n=1 Tax=Halogranum gelatinilyticum TaxID=660521 RepID=A0A1G9PUB5_9EURY|nr:CrcB family protein [Halogranum gelatinilyticum]SDM02368.1 CrcB protein [Halogranum gelatinilyticum]